MKTTHAIFLNLLIILSSFIVKGQVDPDHINDGSRNPTHIATAIFIGEVPSIESRIANGTFKPDENIVKEFNPKRWGSNASVPGKGLPVGKGPLWEQ